MGCRGNVMAKFHSSELRQLAADIERLQPRLPETPAAGVPETAMAAIAANLPLQSENLESQTDCTATHTIGTGEFSSSEDSLFNADELQSVAEAFEFDGLDCWLSNGDLEMPLSGP